VGGFGRREKRQSELRSDGGVEEEWEDGAGIEDGGEEEDGWALRSTNVVCRSDAVTYKIFADQSGNLGTRGWLI